MATILATDTFTTTGFKKSLTPGEFFAYGLNCPIKKVEKPADQHAGNYYSVTRCQPIWANGVIKIQMKDIIYRRLENQAGKVFGYKYVGEVIL